MKVAALLLTVLLAAGCMGKPAEPVMPASAAVPDERAKKITRARADLQAGLTALSLRAVTLCSGGEASETTACTENRQLAAQARAHDVQLGLALLNPALPVDWPAVTTTLRRIVDTAMKKDTQP
jgi:hypothetical protein